MMSANIVAAPLAMSGRCSLIIVDNKRLCSWLRDIELDIRLAGIVHWCGRSL